MTMERIPGRWATSRSTPPPEHSHHPSSSTAAAPAFTADFCAIPVRSRTIQRSPNGGHAVPETAPPIVGQVLAMPGRPLDERTQARMEAYFGRSFTGVRIHTDQQAAQSAEAVDARAYTFGRHIVFGHGLFAPESPVGQRLLAHELTHVVQQESAPDHSGPAAARIAGPESDHAECQAQSTGNAVHAARPAGVHRPVPARGVQREVLGTKFSHPAKARSPYKKITAHFDGARFTVSGDGKQLMQADAQSGRPYTVRPGDAAKCGGKPDDTYLNNPRYVGIADNGPIPEGTFQFEATQWATFSRVEQLKMLPGGNFTDPFGTSLHGGDWGAGRVPLSPVTIVPAPKGCGNTKTRSGFYLHGGVMPGSSGCIDIGNTGVDRLLALLPGYTGKITVTVKYTATPPDVGTVGRAVGRFTYPKKKDPSFLDRLKAGLGLEE
ncbi:eCIS core domain-containing protein [Kitasatospora sp. NPDC001660]